MVLSTKIDKACVQTFLGGFGQAEAGCRRADEDHAVSNTE